ncbi:MAG: hypothetical protein AB1758_03975 [Candidatus Eremiobacterota bacterium]
MTIKVEVQGTEPAGYLEKPARVAEPLPGAVSWLCWVAGVIATFLGTRLLLGSTDTFPLLGFVLYVAGAAALAFGVWWAKGPQHPAAVGWAIFSVFFCLFAGIYGSLISLVVYVLSRGQPSDTPLVDVVRAEMWVQSTAPPERDDTLPLEVQFRNEIKTEPIIDMIPNADVPTALAIADRLAEAREPRQRKLLLRLAQDPRQEVYQYAMAKLNHLQQEFAVRIYQLTEKRRYRPDDADLSVSLASVYCDYIDSGLVEEGLEDYYWELTLAHLFEAMVADPSNTRMPVRMAALLRSRGLFQESLQVLEGTLQRHPGDVGAHLLLLEALYEGGQGAGQAGMARQVRKRALESGWAVKLPRKREGQVLSELAHFWFGARENA